MGLGPRRPSKSIWLRPTVIGAILCGLVLAATAGDGLSAAPASVGAPFAFNFTGDPAAPQPWNPSNWDVAVNSRNVNTFVHLAGMQAQHGANCAPPPATHFNDTYGGAVFLCRNHLMTAINAGGYGEIVLTPDHMVDFSGGEATIRVNVSTARTSDRDWIAFWITPFNDNLVLPIDPLLKVDLQGPPKYGIHVRMDRGAGGTIFRADLINNFHATPLPVNSKKSLETLLGTTSAITRTTFELTISRTHLKFGIPALGYYWLDTPLTGLGFSRAVVQLTHHSYNPTKCFKPSVFACRPDTWHWSNFSISNAVPFTLLRGDQQVVHDAAPGLGVAATPMVVNFPAAAPKSAFLRFAAIGTIEMSIDGGKTWQSPQRQAQEYQVVDHFSSYWTPVPAGTKSVMLRGQRWFGGPWWVRDASIWSTSATSARTSTGPANNGPAPVAPGATKRTFQPRKGVISVILAAFARTPLLGETIIPLIVILLGGAAYLLLRRRRVGRPRG